MDYPNTEQKLKERVDELNHKWHSVCPEDFVSYGFYPYYTQQKYRLLFVGREARGVAGCDYIEVLYKNNYILGKMPRGNFHHRMFYLAYGLLNDFPNYYDIPYSCKIASTDFKDGRLSFAFMNISTISNEVSIATLGDKYAKSRDAGAKFRREMIDILAPDIIVCANCGYDITVLSDDGGYKLLERESDLITTELLQFGKKTCLRFDTYHWGATRVSGIGGLYTKEHFYDPLCDAFRKFQHLIS